MEQIAIVELIEDVFILGGGFEGVPVTDVSNGVGAALGPGAALDLGIREAVELWAVARAARLEVVGANEGEEMGHPARPTALLNSNFVGGQVGAARDVERSRRVPLGDGGVVKGRVVLDPSDGHGVVVAARPKRALVGRLADKLGPPRREVAEGVAIEVKLVDSLAEVDDVKRERAEEILAKVDLLQVDQAGEVRWDLGDDVRLEVEDAEGYALAEVERELLDAVRTEVELVKSRALDDGLGEGAEAVVT